MQYLKRKNRSLGFLDGGSHVSISIVLVAEKTLEPAALDTMYSEGLAATKRAANVARRRRSHVSLLLLVCWFVAPLVAPLSG
jgi:hypothetical protein